MTISPLPPMEGPVCPLPLRHDQTVVMGHGSGGRMTHELIQNTFLPHLSSPWNTGNDFAALPLSQESNVPAVLVVSTDSHIVSPLFFPGGDIGRLA
ncbi:MAG: hydrogenase expression/formation protein HypE, partial [Chloroflexi bacterium]|nr:hydrogenase expression/formation protein HypE [Chloroflexota bacterium]